MLAIINADLLQRDRKASHPWVVVVEIPYNGKGTNGMPNTNEYELLNVIEDDIMSQLKDVDGYLNIGRQTAYSMREIYLSCKDFRTPSKVLRTAQLKYNQKLKIDFSIYKDKYWKTFERFSVSL